MVMRDKVGMGRNKKKQGRLKSITQLQKKKEMMAERRNRRSEHDRIQKKRTGTLKR